MNQDEGDRLSGQLLVVAIAMFPGKTAREKMQGYLANLRRRFETFGVVVPGPGTSDRARRNMLANDITRLEKALERTDPAGHDSGDEDRLR